MLRGVLGAVGLVPAVAVLHSGRILWGGRLRESAPAVDAALVLGMAHHNGVPGRYFAGRLRHAAERALEDPSLDVWVLGGTAVGEELSEAEVGCRELQRLGVPEAQIHPSPEGCDTRGSLLALLRAQPEIQHNRLSIITDPHHMVRARMLARECGLRCAADPTPYCPVTVREKSWWVFLSHEVGGLVVADCAQLAGRRVARRCEDILRAIDGCIRPHRRLRHAQIRSADSAAQRD